MLSIGEVTDSSAQYETRRLNAGNFETGTRAGKGIMVLPDGGVYTGDFSADKWEGNGMYEYPDGSCYVGEWQQGKKHGSGATFSLLCASSITKMFVVCGSENNSVVFRDVLG